MLIYPILAALFAAGVVLNLSKQPADWPNVWVGGGIALALGSMWLWLKMNVRKWRETLDWLRENQASLTDQPQYFRDSPFPMTPVSNRTRLRNFKVVTSCLVYTSMHQYRRRSAVPVCEGRARDPVDPDVRLVGDPLGAAAYGAGTSDEFLRR